jgi:ligand-binding sensor domain-containing protein
MKKKFSQIQVLTFLAILLFGTACNGQVKKDLPKEKEHPKLIKTIGDPRYGNVQCGLQDKAGNLWFGTTENGLYKYDGKSFRQFLVADGLSSNSVNDILEDKDGKIWIGTKDGICVYNGKTFTNIQIPLPKDLPQNKNKFYQTQIVHDMMKDKAGKLWFVTIDGVYVYDGKSFTLFIINEAANGFLSSNDKVERIFEDNAGNIWFGGRTNEGVYRYDGKSVTNLKLKELFQNGPKLKAHNWAWPQLQDKNGNIWFSNWGGAYRYDGKAFTSFTKSDGLADGGVTRIIEDKKGNLWFGGDAGAGLSRYDGKSFTLFTTKDGLVNNSIWSILEDKTGNLWVGTRETGLYLYDGKTFITYSEYRY